MISRVMVKSTKRIGSIVLILNTIYLTWLGFNIVNTVGWLLLIAEILIFSLTLFYIVNHWKQLHVYNHHIVATDKSLDIFITVVNETSAMFEKTLISLTKIDYENKQIYVLDDGPREEIKKLADKHGVTYLARKDKSHSKAGNLNFGVNNSKGEYILVIDADQIVTNPSIAKNLLHYFAEDPKVAMVITRQKFDVPKGDFNHDNLFYDHMQPGKNDNNSAISCGSGVFYRRSALEDIGGFQTWNIVEDLYTSYVFHKSGYRSIYINKSYTLGTAPQDLSTIYKQRGTWALDTLRIFLKNRPFLQKD